MKSFLKYSMPCMACGKATPVHQLLCGCVERLCLRCLNTHQHIGKEVK